MGYNGWSNKATWDVALILDNSSGLDAEAMAIAGEHGDHVQADDALRELVEGLCEELHPAGDLVSQLVSTALAQVDWREIVRSYLARIVEDARP